jgi:N-succinyldiaminopimelate aminotransferase
MAGGDRVPVTLRPPDFRPDLDALRAAITGRTGSSC